MNEIADSRFVAVAVARTSNAKKAAIYFDYVVPVYCEDVPPIILPPHFGAWEPTSSTQLLKKLQENFKKRNLAIDFKEADGSFRTIKLTDSHGEPDLDAMALATELMFLLEPITMVKLQEQMRYALISGAPILLSSQPLDFIRPTITATEVSVTLAGMPLIDVDSVPWEQILELRSDADAHTKLKLLRLFLTNELIGKTPEQIQATVELRLEEYRRAASKHGFNLFVGTLQEFCNADKLISSLILGAFAGCLIAPNSESCATVSCLVGAVCQFVNIVLTCVKEQHDFTEFRKSHPLSYVIEAQKQLSPYSR